MTDLEYLKTYGNPETWVEDQKRLKNGEPVQYIVGNVDFYGNELLVDERVLIPRFETEELIYNLKEYYQKLNITPKRILDLGTGSGCIAITLAKMYPEADVTAVDISKDALDVARENAKRHQVDVTFLEGNFLEPVTGTYDLIISNPPYIDYDEEIEDIVRKNEPALALFADHHGLACYETILKKVNSYLETGGMLAFEIGYRQKNALETLIQRYLKESQMTFKKDMQGKDRMVYIQKR